jgi:hypothetical protein
MLIFPVMGGFIASLGITAPHDPTGGTLKYDFPEGVSTDLSTCPAGN